MHPALQLIGAENMKARTREHGLAELLHADSQVFTLCYGYFPHQPSEMALHSIFGDKENGLG